MPSPSLFSFFLFVFPEKCEAITVYARVCEYLQVTAVEAMNMTGSPMAEERIQLQTLTILALCGVLKSSALTG